MKRGTFPPLVILILAAIVATTSTSAAIVPEHGPSAFGAGLFRFRRQNSDRTELWSFSFEAIANKNGHTRGRAQFENLTAQTQVVVRINCLSVGAAFDTAFAAMSGTVLHSDDPTLPKLETVIFAATDGPLLPTSDADTITPVFPLFPFAGQDCHDTQPLTILPVEDGDIQIQLEAIRVPKVSESGTGLLLDSQEEGVDFDEQVQQTPHRIKRNFELLDLFSEEALGSTVISVATLRSMFRCENRLCPTEARS